MEQQTVKFSIEVTRAQLRAALIFAADKDIRYYLNGVCLHVGECGDARLVATDGHRLAIVNLCDQSSATPGEYLIPRDVLKTVKKAGRLDKIPLLLSIDGDAFQLIDQAARAILGGAKLIDGRFPDYQRVVPMPENMDGTPGTFNASYLADIQRALIELGDKNGFFTMLQNALFGDAKYITTSRENSDAAIAAALDQVARKYGAPPFSLADYKTRGAWQWQTHDGHRLDSIVHQALSAADHSTAPLAQAI